MAEARDTQARSPGPDIWDFALAHYGAAGVKAAALALQDDHGQCVSFLLWRLWAWRRGLAVSPRTLARASGMARDTETHRLRPLRAERRALAAGASRARALDREIEVERGLLEDLARLPLADAPGGLAPTTLIDALAEAVRAYGAQGDPTALAGHLSALADWSDAAAGSKLGHGGA
ncbi:MAG: TIGR02444 family protein [Alphaproteobacteria bacterium]|nr:TIGR02444 family protein [Alphaproteobacteria bacterium]